MVAVSAADPKRNIWLGYFGESWVDVVCRAAWCSSAKAEPDMYDQDRLITHPSGEVIRVQIKTTEHPTSTNAGFTYQLDGEAYDRLRLTNSLGYLFLVVMQPASSTWIRHFKRGSVTRAAGYWALLSGQPAVTTASVSVLLPFANLLRCETLRELFEAEE